MDENAVEGLAEILEAARELYTHRQATFSVAISEPLTSEAFTKWNAVVAAVTEIGWDFSGGAQVPVLGGAHMSVLRFLRKDDPDPLPVPARLKPVRTLPAAHRQLQ
jgi:hypothetical protein